MQIFKKFQKKMLEISNKTFCENKKMAGNSKKTERENFKIITKNSSKKSRK